MVRNRNASTSNREPAPRAAAPARGARQTIVPPADEPEDEAEEQEEVSQAALAPRGPRRDADTPVSRAADRAAARSTTRANGNGAHAPAPSREVARAEPQTRALGAVNGRNAFEEYAQQMQQSSIRGTLIKFNKGDWVDGQNELLDENMELVANMDQLMTGWIKWQDQRPVEQIMGPVIERYIPPRRNTLGDENQDEWEVDNQGRPQDPWQFTNVIVMKEPGQDPTDDNLYTFSTGTKGGLGALGQLCAIYGQQIRGEHEDDYPIVALKADSYMHREYGRMKVPVFEVVGWEPKEQFEAGAAGSAAQGVEDEPEPEPETTRSPARGRGAGGSRNRAA